MPPQSAEQHVCAMRSIVDARQRCFSLSRQGCAGLQPLENLQRQTPVRRNRTDTVRDVLFSATGPFSICNWPTPNQTDCVFHWTSCADHGVRIANRKEGN